LALRCFRVVSPSPAAVGGPVLPMYLAPKPVWFDDRCETFSWGPESRFLSKRESFVGGNMFVRKDVLLAAGGFQVAGMTGDSLHLSDDTDVFRRLASNPEAQLYYHPGLTVFHEVPAAKLELGYQIRRYMMSGASWSEMERPRLARRCYVALGTIARLAARLPGVLGRRYRYAHWKTWALLEWEPVASDVGTLASACGVALRFRHRSS
jgi:hypothetical protein